MGVLVSLGFHWSRLKQRGVAVGGVVVVGGVIVIGRWRRRWWWWLF